jgi:hypothetical protein
METSEGSGVWIGDVLGVVEVSLVGYSVTSHVAWCAD